MYVRMDDILRKVCSEVQVKTQTSIIVRFREGLGMSGDQGDAGNLRLPD